jgi:acyl carrier protein
MGPEGELLPAGATGEIVVRGENVTSAYFTDDPDVNARVFAHGWFHTGDQGHLDADGYVSITGRLKELINRGGEKIAPREVDDVLAEHPAVATALTFAVPDERLGEQVAAAVVLENGADARERELREFVALRLAAHKVPRRVVFVTELPKGPTGKPARIGLAERLGLAELDRDARGPQPHTAPRDDIERWLAQEWSTVLGVHDPSVHDRFLDLGGDSMLATRLLARVRAALAIELSMLDFYDAPTIAAQAALVARLLADEP